MKNQISNEDYNKAYKNVEHKKIASAIFAKYGKSLNKDEYKECYFMGLWEALRNFNPTKNTKFTTFLHLNIVWEIQDTLLKKKKEKRKYITNANLGIYFSKERTNLMECLTDEEMELYHERYIENKSIREMSKEKSVSPVTLLNKIKKIKERIRETVY